MRYSGIIKDDIVNGLGIRSSLFVSGCRNHCKGCFNKNAQDFDYGNIFTEEVMQDFIDSVDAPYYNGITLLGGDPMEPENANELIPLVEEFRKKYGNSKTIWIYTGYLYEDILDLPNTDVRKILLLKADVLVDGPFIESLRDITLKFRGSSNQRIIDCNKSCRENIVLLEEE